MSELVTDLETYARIPAPSGREAELAEIVRQHWVMAGEVTTDRLGNLSVSVGTGTPHLALIAHLDEVGVVVRRITPEGFVQMNRLGGVPERVLTMQRILLLGREGPVEGVVGTYPHHFTLEAEKYRVPTIDQMYLDVGATSQEETTTKLGIRVGDFGTYARTFTSHGGRVLCNALDDRAGLAVLTRVARDLTRRPPPGRVSLIASVQEEFSVQGLVPMVRALQPDVLVIVDVSPATDTPELAGRSSDVRLGSGPVLHLHSFHGRGMLAGVLPPPWLVDAVEAAAQVGEVPLQRASFFGGLTDGSYAQLEHRGIPAVEVGVPVRYTHSPSEMCALTDLEGLVELLLSLCYREFGEGVR